MDTLQAFLAEIALEDEDDLSIGIESVANSGTGLELQLKVTTFGVEDHTRNLLVRCDEVLDYVIRGEGAWSIRLEDDHPLLWPFTHDKTAAYLFGKPVDAYAALGALYEAHQTAVGGWLNLDTYLNPNIGLYKLLEGGHGLLGQGPIPLMEVYKEVLSRYGVEVDVGTSYPRAGEGSFVEGQQQFREKPKVLLIGNSYIVGRGWSSQ